MFSIIKIRSTKNDLTQLFVSEPSKKDRDKDDMEVWTFSKGTDETYILTFLNESVHKVIYQIKTDSEKEREEKYHFMLAQYQEKSKWKFLVDNGFGYLFRSEDGELHASYSYVMDIWTFETDELRQSRSLMRQGKT